MITKLIIDNFKAIRHLELDLRPFQVFVGPNDSGKSTILQALDILGRVSTSVIEPLVAGASPSLFEERFERYLPHGDVNRAMHFKVHGTCDEGVYTYHIGLEAKSSSSSPHLASEELVVADQTRIAGPGHFRNQSELSRLGARFAGISADLRSFIAQFDPRKLAAPALLGAQLESDGTGLASLVDDLLTASDRQPLYEFENQLRRFSSFIGGVSTHPTSDKHGKELLYSLAGTKRPISAKQASSGLVLVTAYLALRYGTGYRRYLIEEPENGIHPHAASLVVQLLRELSLTGAQVLITTHSPLLLNQVAPEDVMVVTRHSDRGIQVKPMVETKLFAERIRDFDLGELWYNIGEDELVAAS
ncbi:MAG TPA: AAA family ATPase [Kofleriaceae bacterium]|nr:AAA family ATPase [Kofleriaceae bacterium]